jgi:alpha-tubulin suppressor-like RCC1 family protein
MKTIYARFASACALALLTACGGGSSGGASPTTPTTPAEPILQSIALSPVNPTIPAGTSLQLVATGTYTDGSTKALTTGLIWSTTGAYSSMFTSGLVKGVSMGRDLVTATLGIVSGSTALTVKGPYVTAAAGGSHTLVRKADGTLAGFGLNHSGQLGDGTAVDRVIPTATVDAANLWTSMSAGDFHTLALRSDGSLWGWGLNQNGQIGDKTVLDKLASTQVGTDKKWSVVAAGKAHSIGVKSDGTLWAWGRNFDGQLGDVTGVDKTAPIQVLMAPAVAGSTTAATAVAADKIWVAAGAGSNFTVGFKTDNTLYTWGGNERGQLGNGTSVAPAIASNVPTLVAGLKVLSLSVGNLHVLAIRPDGALFSWGANELGQLGNGKSTDGKVPAQVGTETDWKMVSAGGFHSLAVKVDGSLWSWGSNSDGQLGVGTTAESFEPKQIGLMRDWVFVSAGKYHSFALKSDGTLWGWGRNYEGQQGNGTMTVKPVLVPTQLP